MEKPTLTQLSTLRDILEKDEALNKHFDLSDTYERIQNITLKQYNYFNLLIIKRKKFKLNALMVSLNFKQNYV